MYYKRKRAVGSEDDIVILDIGSGFSTCGIAGEDDPRFTFRTCLSVDDENPDSFSVGNSAKCSKKMTLKYPVQRGSIVDFSSYKKLINYALRSECCVGSDNPVMIIHPARIPDTHRNNIASYIFEDLDLRYLYYSSNAVLTMYSTGHTTGVVIHSGHGVTSVTPIYEGYLLPHCVFKRDFGGLDVERNYIRMLDRRLGSLRLGEEILRQMKHDMSYVCEDFEKEMLLFKEKPTAINRKFKLPDGKTVEVGSERFCAVESFFNPQFDEYDCGMSLGIQEMVNRSVMKIDDDEGIEEVFKAVIFGGGNSIFKGIEDRMKNELYSIVAERFKDKIKIPKNDKKLNSAFNGGSILASLGCGFNRMWISKEEWNESGPPIILRKCF